jgi:hypothetical protein
VIPVHRLPALPKGDIATREQALLRTNHDLRTALERYGPFDLVYERYALFRFAGMEYARAVGVPGLLEVNAPLIQEQVEHRGLVDRAGAEQAEVRAFGAATTLIAVSEEIARDLKQNLAVRGAVHVIPNGVNPDRFPADMEPSCPAPPGNVYRGVCWEPKTLAWSVGVGRGVCDVPRV